MGATISALISERLFNELDAPLMRLAMDDAPVPYSLAMEKEVVKREEDLVKGVVDIINNKN